MASRTPRGRDSRRQRPTGRAAGVRPARTPARTKAASTAPTPGNQAGKAGSGPQITTRAVLLLTVVLLLLGSYTATFRAWWSQRQDIQATKAERTDLKRDIVTLEDQKRRFDDPAYIKQQARERFGWVMPGEVGYRVIGSDGAVRGQVPTLDAPTEPKDEEWYDRLWGSVETSGEPEADVAPRDTTGEVLEDE